jgi:hypothetical protein
MQESLSAVAGILDAQGGLRIVVTQRWRMKFHIGKGERAFIVPGFLLQEPVPWNYIPVMVRRVELYIEWWITTRNDPASLSAPAIQRYLRNPNAYHNRIKNGIGFEFHYMPQPRQYFQPIEPA